MNWRKVVVDWVEFLCFWVGRSSVSLQLFQRRRAVVLAVESDVEQRERERLLTMAHKQWSRITSVKVGSENVNTRVEGMTQVVC